MRRRAAAVQQARRGEQVGAGADRRGAPRATRGARDPVDDRRVRDRAARALAAGDDERVVARRRLGQRLDAEPQAVAHRDPAVGPGADHVDPVGAGHLALGVREDLHRPQHVERLAPSTARTRIGGSVACRRSCHSRALAPRTDTPRIPPSGFDVRGLPQYRPCRDSAFDARGARVARRGAPRRGGDAGRGGRLGAARPGRRDARRRQRPDRGVGHRRLRRGRAGRGGAGPVRRCAAARRHLRDHRPAGRRRGPDVRRHRARSSSTSSSSARRARRCATEHRGRPPGRARHAARRARGGHVAGGARGRRGRRARHTELLDASVDARRARVPRRGPLRRPPLQRAGRDDGLGPARRDPRVRLAAAHGDLRGDRLLRRARADRDRDRLRGHDRRRPPGLRRQPALRRARRGRGLLAGRVPARPGRSARATPCWSSPTTRSSTSRR